MKAVLNYPVNLYNWLTSDNPKDIEFQDLQKLVIFHPHDEID